MTKKPNVWRKRQPGPTIGLIDYTTTTSKLVNTRGLKKSEKATTNGIAVAASLLRKPTYNLLITYAGLEYYVIVPKQHIPGYLSLSLSLSLHFYNPRQASKRQIHNTSLHPRCTTWTSSLKLVTRFVDVLGPNPWPGSWNILTSCLPAKWGWGSRRVFMNCFYF